MAKQPRKLFPILLLTLACLSSVGCALFQAIPQSIMHPMSSGETQYEVCVPVEPDSVGGDWITFKIGNEGAGCDETATVKVHRLISSDKLKAKVLGLKKGTMITLKISNTGFFTKLTVMKKAPVEELEFE